MNKNVFLLSPIQHMLSHNTINTAVHFILYHHFLLYSPPTHQLTSFHHFIMLIPFPFISSQHLHFHNSAQLSIPSQYRSHTFRLSNPKPIHFYFCAYISSQKAQYCLYSGQSSPFPFRRRNKPYGMGPGLCWASCCP